MTQFNRSNGCLTNLPPIKPSWPENAGTAAIVDQQYRYDQLQMQQRLAQLQADAAGGNAAAQREVAMPQAQMQMDQFNAQRADQSAQTAWQQAMAEQQFNAGQGQQSFANQMAMLQSRFGAARPVF